MASNFQWSASSGDFERSPELFQLRVASSFLIGMGLAFGARGSCPGYPGTMPNCQKPKCLMFTVVITL